MNSNRDQVWPDFTFYHYALKLHPAVELKSGRLDVRRGFLVRCEKSGAAGWGDIAPLDGYSPESFEQVKLALPEIKAHLAGKNDLTHDYPSVQCGLEFAHANWRAAEMSRSLYLSLNGVPEKTHLPMARLIAGSTVEGSVSEVKKALKDGYACMKIKVGAQPLDKEIHRIRQIQSMLPPGVEVRLDANRRWSLEEALEFSRSISSAGIAFIEEPLKQVEDYPAYDHGQPHMFALDESLRVVQRKEVESWRKLRAVVLKPTLLGGVSRTMDWMAWAQQRSIQAVISATFESGLGIRNLIALAGACAIETPAGLDTYAYLVDDVVKPVLQFRRGRVALYQTFPKSWEIDFAKLEKIL